MKNENEREKKMTMMGENDEVKQRLKQSKNIDWFCVFTQGDPTAIEKNVN